MFKFYILILCLTSVTHLIAQTKPDPIIGKKEAEVSLFICQAGNINALAGNNTIVGAEFNYRWPLNHPTKIGGGLLIAAEIVTNSIPNKNFLWYGALYGDITQFFGEKQKWGITGRIGHGIYNQETEFEGANEKGFFKYTGGMYYSFLLNYRAIISKNLFVIAPFWNLRNLRYRSVTEYKSPASIERIERTEEHMGFGLKVGVIF